MALIDEKNEGRTFSDTVPLRHFFAMALTEKLCTGLLSFSSEMACIIF
jgi:hypothetical protein